MAQVLYSGRPALLAHPWSLLIGIVLFFGSLVLVLVQPLLLLTALIGLFFLAGPFIARLSAQYTITEDTVEERRGILSRHTSEVSVADIRNVQVHQSLLGRFLGIGDVLISTAGQSGMEVALRGVEGPNEIVGILKRARSRPPEAEISRDQNVARSRHEEDDEPNIYVIE